MVRDVEDASGFENLDFGNGFDPVEAVNRLAPAFGDRWLGWQVVDRDTGRLLQISVSSISGGGPGKVVAGPGESPVAAIRGGSPTPVRDSNPEVWSLIALIGTIRLHTSG